MAKEGVPRQARRKERPAYIDTYVQWWNGHRPAEKGRVNGVANG